ncbi:maltokinase N-terminal cap-like domain-containing protein [Nocardia arthritidis]|uniref:1,4-alpha-glucan branching protein n=1 Tax=Nocardia arthritidis TaxID=228602 RepID=A0A6G9YH93_9NOCA|nr:1,4-alpha-glucan branching protein [Nocardia arthritidis]QIS12554.1 1,4-alpha-glucan branching protein [Nocardia arthritidis]
MAIVHDTTMRPTKLELLTRWLPTRPWYVGERTPVLAKAGGFRVDDPAGAVGIEFLVLIDSSAAEPATYHVPMTYRGEPLEGADFALIGTSEHGVLGTRWLYDATRDPVFLEQAVRLLAAVAVPQDQNVSNKADPSVQVRVLELGSPAAGFDAAAVTDTDLYTEIVLETGRLLIHRRLGIGGVADAPGQARVRWWTLEGLSADDVFLSAVPS